MLATGKQFIFFRCYEVDFDLIPVLIEFIENKIHFDAHNEVVFTEVEHVINFWRKLYKKNTQVEGIYKVRYKTTQHFSISCIDELFTKQIIEYFEDKKYTYATIDKKLPQLCRYTSVYKNFMQKLITEEIEKEERQNRRYKKWLNNKQIQQIPNSSI